MNELPSVRAYSIGSPSLPDLKPYVYKGDQPFVPPKPVPPGRECIADGCVKKRHSATYCERHYRNVKLYGIPDVPDRRRKENRDAGSRA